MKYLILILTLTFFLLSVQSFALVNKIKKTRRDGPPSFLVSTQNLSNAVPKAELQSLSGNDPFYVTKNQRYFTLRTSKHYKQRGIASWYGTQFHGRKTSSGEPYNMLAMTAAHKTLPLPTYAKVTNLENGKTIVVKINDRGPFYEDRLIDLSWAAAKKLGIRSTAFVEVEAIAPHAKPHPQAKEFTYHLQVAAFKQRARALKLKNRLHQSFRGNVIMIKKVNNFYRVRMGPYTNLKTVKYLTKQLRREKYGEPVIIKS